MSQFTAQAANIPQPTPPAAVTNYGVSPTVAPTPDQAQAAIDASIAAASAQTKQNVLAAFQGMNPVCDPSSEILDAVSNTCVPLPNPSGLSTTALIALGLVAGAVLLLLTSTGGGRRRR